MYTLKIQGTKTVFAAIEGSAGSTLSVVEGQGDVGKHVEVLKEHCLAAP
jgi:hypothetical protein